MRTYIFVIVILAAGWGVWLHRMGVDDHDDAVSNELLFARQPVAAIVLDNPWPDQSPLYFIVLHGLGRIGESPFVVQFFNAVLLTAVLLFTYVCARMLTASRVVGVVAVLLGTLSPASLWVVRNGRMYSIQLLLTVLGMLALMRYLDGRRRRDLAAFAALCVLNIYNHFGGFLVTAVLFVPLVQDACARWWRTPASDRRSRTIADAAVAITAVVLLSLPQLQRLRALFGMGAPIRRGLSVPPLSAGLIEQLYSFWFVNADWGALRRGGVVVSGVYAASIVCLGAVGIAAGRWRHRLVALASVVAPLLILGSVAATMDVRVRYFVWVLPTLWIAVAAGGVGPLSGIGEPGALEPVQRGFRQALALVVVLGSSWLLWHKLPERYPQWTKLMSGLQQIYRPSMVVYMPPGPPTGTPRIVADSLHAPAGLSQIQTLTPDTRDQFLAEESAARDFVFLVHWSYENDELQWRDRYLMEHGYQRLRWPVWGARADIYSRGGLDVSNRDRIGPDVSPGRVVSWARTKLAATAPRPDSAAGAGGLKSAIVADVAPDGSTREARVFASQRGEDGGWRLGESDSDLVYESAASSGGDERAAVVARPTTDRLLVVAFPARPMKSALVLTYGTTDSAVRLGLADEVAISLFVNGTKQADLRCPGDAGWHVYSADTRGLEGRSADVVLLIAGKSDHPSELAFDVAEASRTGAHLAHLTHLTLTGGRTLEHAVDRLIVYRRSSGLRTDARPDGTMRSEVEMHEARGPRGEGAVRTNWMLGSAPWDSVGVTTQRSGGESRTGLWVHPKNGTTLVLEAPDIGIGRMLHGYLGLTDLSVDRASETGVVAPVRVRVLVDDAILVNEEITRTRGWRLFDAPVPPGTGNRRLRVEVESDSDSWAHLVFNVWSD